MLRKILLVIVAVASLSAASLAPTPASAYWRGGGWGWGGGWGPGWRGGGWGPGWGVAWGPGWGPGWGWRRAGWGWGGPRVVVAPGFYGGGCVVRRLVPGPWGPRWVLVNRCW
jgi:hypothetical protein